MRKKKIILPQLNDCEGDLSQRWFVYYSVHNPKTDNLKRFKVYKGFDKLKTSDGRYSHAEKMMTDLRKKLQIGWSPFIKEDVIVYMDEIMYSNQASLSGRTKLTLNNLRPLQSEFLTEQKIKVAPKTYESYQSKTRLFAQ